VTTAATPLRSAARWLPWALLAAVAAVALILGAHRASAPSLEGEVQHIAGLVRCPVCAGETAAQSQSPPSVEIRSQIRQDLKAGMNQGQVLDQLVRAYGPGILEKPQASGVSLVVWVAPLVVVAGGLVVLVAVLRRWARPAARPSAAAAPRLRRRAPAAWRSRVLPALRARRKWLVVGAGAAALAGAVSWALSASVGTRAAGQPITGVQLGAAAVQADMQAAANDASRGDVLGAVEEYQKVLASDPTDPEALTQEGWLLAETRQPSLARDGLQLLLRAEKADPVYAPAHLYRGVALLGGGDYAAAVPELQWYLAHSPDPRLVPQVKAALAQAQAKQGSR
jgi:cytochrome c-type biogenesis protein CcmH